MAHFTATTVTIEHNGRTTLTGQRSPITRLWTLDLPLPPSPPPIASAHAVVHNPNLAARIAFFHASMFSLALSTWCTAIDAGHMTTWSELTSAQVHRYPPRSTPMLKGHLDQECANTRSTKPKQPLTGSAPSSLPTNGLAPPDISTDISPEIPLSNEPPALKTWFLYAYCQQATGQIYTNPTGRFLIPSISGNQY